jgi:hypothetical protein
MNTSPVLSTPPAFILLAVLVGLAAYLRQLGEARDRLIDDIEGGKVWNYPVGERHTAERLEHLKTSRDRLNWVAPPVIWLTILITLRMEILAFARLRYPGEPEKFATVFRPIDFVIVTSFLVLLLGLWYMHKKTRQNDDRIRALADGWRADRRSRRCAVDTVHLL